MRLSFDSASKAAVVGVRCDGGSVTRSLYVFDKRNRRARIDAAKRTILVFACAAFGTFAIVIADRFGFADRAFDQLALGGGGPHNRLHVGLAAALGSELFPRRVRLVQRDRR